MGKKMEFNTVIYERDEKIEIVTLNRPKQMNAVDRTLVGEMIQLIEEIADDDEIRAVIIKGNEKFFCVGADIKDVIGITSSVEAHQWFDKGQALMNIIENLEKPVIAAVSGSALGGGCELVLSCDIRVAAENAVFGLPEIKLAVIPGGGGTQRLPRLVGVGRAKEMIYSGDTIDAHEAYRIGLVNKVVPVESLMGEAKRLAQKLASRPAFALKMAKMVVNKGINIDLQSALSLERSSIELLFSTEDQKEGMKAFIENRKPIFKGR
jgi:enoyl-CoA hydratase